MVGMNIYNRYSKILKVNFYEVLYATLTLSGINIAMLVKFFFLCHCYRCLVARRGFGQVARNRGFEAASLQQIFTVFT